MYKQNQGAKEDWIFQSQDSHVTGRSAACVCEIMRSTRSLCTASTTQHLGTIPSVHSRSLSVYPLPLIDPVYLYSNVMSPQTITEAVWYRVSSLQLRRLATFARLQHLFEHLTPLILPWLATESQSHLLPHSPRLPSSQPLIHNTSQW